MSIKVMSWVWDHSPAQGSELLLLLALADFADDHGMNAYPSIDRLADKCRVSRKTVKRLLQKLIAIGQLAVVQPGGGRGRTNRYRVLMAGQRYEETGSDRPGIDSERVSDRPSLLQETGSDRPVLLREKGSSEAVKGVTALTPDPSGTVINGEGLRNVRARETVGLDSTPPQNSIDHNVGPPDRCAAHAAIDEPPPCGACKEARIARNRWEHDEEIRRREAERRERKDAQRARNRAIHRCRLCDPAGYLPSGAVCNHVPDQADRNRAGAAAVRAALAAAHKSREGDDAG